MKDCLFFPSGLEEQHKEPKGVTALGLAGEAQRGEEKSSVNREVVPHSSN